MTLITGSMNDPPSVERLAVVFGKDESAVSVVGEGTSLDAWEFTYDTEKRLLLLGHSMWLDFMDRTPDDEKIFYPDN